MAVFKHKEKTKAAKLSTRARYVDEDVQRVDLTIKDADGDSVVVELTLDQVRKLVADLTVAYSVCRPGLLSKKDADRIATRMGMR